MATAGDTFVETSNTALASHTPTGSNAGSGWTQALGSMTVLGADDLVEDANQSAGNRAGMNTNIGSDQMDVSLDVSFVGATVGSPLLAGPSSRLSAASSTSALYEFVYDWGVGTNGSYILNSDSLDQAWPGGTVTMQIKTRASDHRGFANGVQKVSVTTNLGSGNTYSGIVLANFTADARRARGDNFLAASAADRTLRITQSNLRW